MINDRQEKCKKLEHEINSYKFMKFFQALADENASQEDKKKIKGGKKKSQHKK